MQKAPTMIRSTAMAGLAACLAAGAWLAINAVTATPADADRSWKRSGTVIGPHGGTTTWHRSAHCADGSCSRGGHVTGPAGYTRSWERERTCADGVCTSHGSYTGRAGNIWTRSGTVGRAP